MYVPPLTPDGSVSARTSSSSPLHTPVSGFFPADITTQSQHPARRTMKRKPIPAYVDPEYATVSDALRLFRSLPPRVPEPRVDAPISDISTRPRLRRPQTAPSPHRLMNPHQGTQFESPSRNLSATYLDAGLSPPRIRESKSLSLSMRALDLFEFIPMHKAKVIVKTRAKTFAPQLEEHVLPTQVQLREAVNLPVINASGIRVRFGDIWKDGQTIVIFIRHFWCPACQDYMRSIVDNVDIEALAKIGLKIAIIGVGSPSLIAPYSRLVNSRMALFTDPTLAIHRALGMTLKSTDAGPEALRGSYIKRSVIAGIGKVVIDALAGRMPVIYNGGSIGQLGGEFVLGPGLTCTYAHRMTNTRSHTPILDVVAAAGVDANTLGSFTRPSWSSTGDEEAWMARRRISLDRIREKRRSRRAGLSVPGKLNRSVSVKEVGLDEWFESQSSMATNGMCDMDGRWCASSSNVYSRSVESRETGRDGGEYEDMGDDTSWTSSLRS